MATTAPRTGEQTAATQPMAPRDDLFRATEPGSVALRENEGDGDGRTLYGHFARFGEWTEIDSFFEGRFMERIAPGAFKKTLTEGSPKVLFNHGRDVTLGDKVLGQVEVAREDDEGAYYEVALFPALDELLMDGLRAGAYGASFRFSVLREEWVEEPRASADNPNGLPERTLTEVRVHEFGPVTFPAYEGASAGVRSLTDRFAFEVLARDESARRALIEFRNGGAGAEPHPAGAEQDPEPEPAREQDAPPKGSAGARPHPADGRRVTRTPLAGVSLGRKRPHGLLPQRKER